VDLNWMQSVFYGFLSGMTDILPVSAQAHKILFLKFLGIKASPAVLELFVHTAVLLALYYSSQSHLTRMRRAKSLSRVPKKKRKRPLDTRSLMDWNFFITIIIPAFIGLFLYQYVSSMQSNLVYISLFLFLNGTLLYAPQFFTTGNRDARTLSRVEGILMGLGGMLSIFPGISAIGASTSISSVCGIDRKYALNMAFLLNMVITAGWAVYDILEIFAVGFGSISLFLFFQYLLTAIFSFIGTLSAVKIMRYLADNSGFSLFGVYCWGMALFIFILNLIA